MELAQWLTSKSVKRMMYLSEETNEDLVSIRESLLELKTKWESDIDIKQIHKQYQNELTCKRKEEEQEKEKQEK